MPSSYFETKNDDNNNNNNNCPPQPTGAESIRNLAVIAHVDHGKTTLSDALLHRAGLLSSKRAGDQVNGRSLDTLPDEKERGITIKSAAITLHLNVEAGAMEKSSRKFAKKNEQEEIYVGNLPRGMKQADFVNYLTKAGDVSSNDIIMMSIQHWNSHRGFAILRTTEPLASSLRGLSIDGHSLVVQKWRDDPMNHLKMICQEQNMEMPNLKAVKKQVDDGQPEQYIGTASWPAMGGATIQAPVRHLTAKEARQAVAQECLHFWRQQKNGHKIVPPPKVNSNTTIVNSNVPDGRVLELVPMVINLIDSPGHIEFNAEVTAALRVSDGALLVVDAVEGKSAQTDNVLRQALREGVVPILMLNKVDRLFIDKQLSPKEAYDRMAQVVDDVNGFIAANQLENFPDLRVSFEAGTVCFGSGYFQWSCSLDTFLPKFTKNGASNGEDQTLRKTLAKRENFIEHILRPIVRMHRACGVLPSMTDKEPTMLERVSTVTEAIKTYTDASGHRLLDEGEDPSTIHPRKLLKKAMATWLPAADALVNMVASHVPSPVQAQPLRAAILYSGEVKGDPCGQGIYDCDPTAPAVVYISKMSPGPAGKRLLAFGRIFSGTVRSGDILRALRTDGTESKAKISKVMLCGIGNKMHPIPFAEAGQLIVLDGIDEALHKAGTLTSSEEGKAIRHMDMVVTPIFQRGIRPKNRSNLTKMVSAMQQIVNADSTALFFLDRDTREYILAGSGELHIEVLVSSLFQASGIAVELSDPIVAYREGVQQSSEVALAKSANKHNRIYIKTSPLYPDVLEALAAGKLDSLNLKSIARELTSNFGWSASEAARIWAIGPEPRSQSEATDSERPTCMLVDSTFGLQIPQDGRDNIIAAFQQVVRSGVLVHAPMRGVRFDLVDAKFHQDAVHRGPNAVVPAAARAMQAAFLMAEPCLVEPIYDTEIIGEAGSLNGAYAILGQRSAKIVDTSSTSKSDKIHALLPVRCAVGLADSLRLATKGQAHCTCLYGGMKLVPESETAAIIAETRKQKSLDEKVPNAETFMDKL